MSKDRIPKVDGPSFRLCELAEVTSTNDVVKRAIEAGEPEGLAVRARRQTGGYGRQGRTWSSPEGGLYLSLLLRPQVPPAQLPTLSLVAGLAVREAVASFVDTKVAESVLVKWPNDVVVRQDCGTGANERCGAGDELANDVVVRQDCGEGLRGYKITDSGHFQGMHGGARAGACSRHASDQALSSGGSEGSRREGAPGSAIGDFVSDSRSERVSFPKLCGISLEAHAGGVCAGIGVNVALPEGSREVGVGGKNQPVYLAELAGWGHADALGRIGAVAQAVLDSFSPLYAAWCERGFAALMEEYDAHASLKGMQVRIADRAGRVLCEGRAVGVDAQGRLLVEASQGVLTPVSSGEAHVLGR